jgi:predicted MFS family arabinose efflux permease
LIGLGTGSTALVFGSLVVGRWFEKYRGVVFGVIGSAFATGQLIFLPIIAHTIESSGWQEVSLWVGIGALILVPLVWFTIADSPAEVGMLPLGVDAQNYSPPIKSKSGGFETATTAIAELFSVYKSRIFILLATTFFICGWTTNGIISTHFVPAAHDHGMSTVTASGLLAIVGIFDIAGTIGSGWLSERFDPRKLLSIYYSLRGVALLAVPIFLGPNPDIPLFLTMMLFGLDWVATVPPTVILCQRAFGVEKGSVIFGWVFAAHMIGAAIAASFSGLIRDQFGEYTTAWYFAGFLAISAAALALMIPKIFPNETQPTKA